MKKLITPVVTAHQFNLEATQLMFDVLNSYLFRFLLKNTNT